MKAGLRAAGLAVATAMACHAPIAGAAEPAGGATVQAVDEFVVVDCRLPPKIRKLGMRAVYQVPGRLVRLPARECAARGGEYTLFDPANYKNAIGLWLTAAEGGDTNAQTNVATLYEKAKPPQYEDAARWYKRAADAGYGPAQVSLGRLYEQGLGVPKDVVKAFNLYRQAAGITGETLQVVTSAELTGLREGLKKSQRELESLQSRVADQKKEIDALRRMLSSKRAQGASDGDTAVLQQMLSKSEQEYAARVARLEKETEQLKAVPPPTLEIVYPRAEESGRVRSLHVRSGTGIDHVVLRVVSAAGIARVLADGQRVTADENGYFLLPLSQIRHERSITVSAVDFLGREASVSLALSGKADRAADGVAVKVPAEAKYYALVIGNTHFKFLAKIDNAEKDARAIADILKDKYGFTVRLLVDASRHEILSAFNDLRGSLKAEDRLLIYYAGHGHLVVQIDRGYWIPVDAEADRDVQWILNDQVTDYLQIIPARQILVISDSCYSGAFTRAAIQRPKVDLGDSGRAKALDYLASRRVRTVMTSGGLQPVLDEGPAGHSVFAAALIDVLGDNRETLEANRLFDAVYPVVVRASTRLGLKQTPTYRAIKFAGHEGGDFLFIPRR